jgi:hypothetical protein
MVHIFNLPGPDFIVSLTFTVCVIKAFDYYYLVKRSIYLNRPLPIVLATGVGKV